MDDPPPHEMRLDTVATANAVRTSKLTRADNFILVMGALRDGVDYLRNQRPRMAMKIVVHAPSIQRVCARKRSAIFASYSAKPTSNFLSYSAKRTSNFLSYSAKRTSNFLS